MVRQCTDQSVGHLLHAYEIGVLTDTEIDTFEVHLLECSYCAEEAETREQVMYLLRHGVEIRRLTQRTVLVPEPHSFSMPGFGINWSKFSWPLFRWAAVSVVLILLAYSAARFLTRSADAPVSRTGIITLLPTRSMDVPQLHRSEGRRGTVLFFYADAKPNESYQLVVTDSLDHIIYSDSAFSGFSELRTACLLVDMNRLPNGTYLLTIGNPDAKASRPRQEYYFDVAE